eukprot:scaffold18064_cov18-Prasinocladus_malaysianus.AAC.2
MARRVATAWITNSVHTPGGCCIGSLSINGTKAPDVTLDIDASTSRYFIDTDAAGVVQPQQ